MRDSFFHIRECYMTTERPEDFEQVRDYVVEQTRTASLEQMTVDLTLQNTGDFQQGFTIEKRRVGQEDRLCFVWWDFSECENHIDCRRLQNGDPSTYFSLIEPADKEWLMRLAEKQKDV